MCRWNRLRMFCVKPRHPSHFAVIGLDKEIHQGACTLCGEWQGEKHEVDLRREDRTFGGIDSKYSTGLCIKCAKRISKNHQYAIYASSLKEVVKEFDKMEAMKR